MARFDYQFAKTDTLASQMAAGATSGTLSTGNFANFTADYVVLDYDTSSREIIKCNVTGTAISSATRGVDGTSDVTHAAGAKVGYMWLPVHADFLSDAAETGWIGSQDTWVYASASTFTIASIDRTAIYTKGTKLRFKQGGGYKYATVASSAFGANTTVTIIVNTDYTVANAAITDNAYSYVENPQAFPHWFAYTPTLASASGTAPTYTAVFVSKYRVIGSTLTGKIAWQNDAGGTAGSGTNKLTFTVPVAIAALDTTYQNFESLGAAICFESGGTINTAHIVPDSSTTCTFTTSAGANLIANDQSSTARRIGATFCYLF